MKLLHAKKIAVEFAELIKPYCCRLQIAGGIRRYKPDPHDIELVAISKANGIQKTLFGDDKPDGAAITQGLKDIPNIPNIDIIKDGDKYKKILYYSVPIDLFITTREQWGWRLLLATGPKEFNIAVVQRLKSRGYMTMNGHIYRGDRIDTPEEKPIFKLLGIPYLHPRNRSPNIFGGWET